MHRSLAFVVVGLLAACSSGDPTDDAVAGDGLGGETGDPTSAIPRVTCGGASTQSGVDVSFYQGAIDWPRVAGAGYTFAFIRVSDGLTYRDERFASNWAGARSAGLARGAYQFFRPAQSATAQADLLIDAIGAIGPGDLPPVIDVEATGSLAPATVAARVQTWVSRVRDRLGVEPIVYTGKYFWEDNVGSSQFANLPLWLAQYTSATCPDLPSQWSRWSFWQYSDAGSVPGIAGGVDVNRFNGSRADLDRLTQRSSAAIEVYWARHDDGAYDLRALAPAAVTRVVYQVDGNVVGSAKRTDGDNFPATYRFSSEGQGRAFEVRGFDVSDREIGLGVGAIDVTAGTAVAIKQLGDRLYEVSLERAPAEVAAIEVRLDGWLLTDAVGGETRSRRRAVRSSLTQLGTRTVTIRTYAANGTVRGTITRTFNFR